MITLRQFVGAWSIRHSFGSNDNKRDAGQTTPEDVIRFDNILFGNDERLKKWQLLDVYRPKAQGDGQTTPLKKLPVIVSVHGGAWVYGDKDRYQFYCMRLAQYGFADLLRKQSFLQPLKILKMPLNGCLPTRSSTALTQQMFFQ